VGVHALPEDEDYDDEDVFDVQNDVAKNF